MTWKESPLGRQTMIVEVTDKAMILVEVNA
jgi:hypothetical protein